MELIMGLGDRRRRFPGRGARRRPRARGTAWPPMSAGRDRVDAKVGRCVSLGLAAVLVVALLYALVKFFEMVRAIRIDARQLWFVPAVIVAVVVVVLLRVVRPLLRDVLGKTSPK